VIDDSKDMVGSDGFSVGSDKTWPILKFLMPSLGCQRCCTWSAFRANGKHCGTPCTAKVPSLTDLSLLIESLESAVTIGASDAYFVTNGLDWRAEGQNRSYRVEMDAGSILTKWVRSGPNKNVVVGIVQDNMGGHRRQNLLLGLISRTNSGMSCELQPDNLPPAFNIRAQRFLNPEGMLDHGVLSIYPTVQVAGKFKSNTVTQVYEVGADGLVRLPLERVKVLDSPQMKVTFKFNSRERLPFCWGITAVTAAGDRLLASCDSRVSGSTVCTFTIPPFSSWPRGDLRLSLRTAPASPAWISASVADSRHSIRKTLSSFEVGAEVPRRFRVTGARGQASGRTSDSLVVILQGSVK